MFILIIVSCSTQKNTGGSRFWHSFNAKYNTYYNGTLAYIDGSLEKENGNKDNFTELIPLYTVGNKGSVQLGSANFDKAIEKCEKAIKLHSIKKRPEWNKKRRKTDKDIEWLNRKEYNPMLWKAWLLMGRSQFHKGEFDAAASTFSYMSRIYQTQPAIYGKARAWQAKCYIAEGWMYDAEDVIRKMSRDSLHWSAKREWNSTLADYYIHTKEYDRAIPYLREVIKKERRKKQKAREWFLMGQLYEELGKREAAYKAYRKVIRQNPPYELEFNARIAMTEVMAAGQTKKMISKLKSMARNDNNAEYLDQVYYAIGNIYMTQKDTLKAIDAYEKGNRESTRNGIEKGVLLLRLGDIYWQMEKYGDAGRCYGEAIGLLDKDRKDYEQLADRSKKLDELVPFTDAIHLQDSLQVLANMDEKSRNDAIDRVIDALKKKEKEEKRLAEEQNAQQTIQRNAQAGSNRTNNVRPPIGQNQKSGVWYFYNQMAVNQGKQAFQKLWGKRDNVDHWQRMNKTVVDSGTADNADSEDSEMPADSINGGDIVAKDEAAASDSLAADPHNREYYLAQIPFTDEQKEASNLIIMDALYNSGVIFKDKLDNLKLSEKQFLRLVTQYPDYENMADAYYHMFLLYSRMGNHVTAEQYVNNLKTGFPDSQWTVLLTDPHFAENQKFGVHIEDSLYAATYAAFKADRFGEIRTNVRLSAERFPLGANRDKFVFIGGISKLNSGDADGCINDMNTIVKEYPDSKLAEMAGMIINGVNQGRQLRGGRFDMGDVWARRSAVLSDADSLKNRQFTDDPNAEFVFMIAYKPDSLDENQLLYTLAKYNFTSYLVRNFDIELEDQDGLHVMRVNGFNNYQEALEYAHQFYMQANISKILGSSRTYIISRQNLELLGVNYSYDDYDKYYNEHFAPLKVDDSRRLFEPAGSRGALDDGGSVPGNISPFIKQQQQQQEEDENIPADDGSIVIPEDNGITVPVTDDIVISDDSVSVEPADVGTVVVEDSPVETQPADGTIVIGDVPTDNTTPVDSDTDTDGQVIIVGDEDKNTSDDDGTVVVPEEEAEPQNDSDAVIIFDGGNAETDTGGGDDVIIVDGGDDNPADDDGTVIIIDGDQEMGTEDETLDTDGF